MDLIEREPHPVSRPPSTPAKANLIARVPPLHLLAVDAIAARDGVRRSDVVRSAIARYLDHEGNAT